MEIEQLNQDEAMVLVGLMREIVQADDAFSDEERSNVYAVRQAMGPDRFDDTVVKARETFGTRGELKEAAKALERADARQLIYDVCKRIAESDGLDDEEIKPLRWLASWWGTEKG